MPDESDEGADVDGSEEPREDTGEERIETHAGGSSDSSREQDATDDSGDEDASESQFDFGPDVEPQSKTGTGSDDELETDQESNDDGGSSDESVTESEPESESHQGSDGESDSDSDLDTNSNSDSDSDSAIADDGDGGEAIETDGEGYVHDRPDSDTGESEYPEPDPDDNEVGGISTPPDDEEMPLADHIEEMILRLARVVLVASAATAIGLLGASQAIEFIWFSVFPFPVEDVPPPHVYHPLELWLSRIKVAALAGVLVALPMFVYECYAFMRPGLYPNERKYYISAVPMSLVLAAFGMFVSYILVLPILFRYFTYYSDASANIAYGLGDTFDMIVTLTGFLAIVFQIPLFIMLAIMMGVTTRRWLADKRLYFWAAFLGLSFMFTLDPTGMAPIIVAIIMIMLFEGTLLVLKWVGRE